MTDVGVVSQTLRDFPRTLRSDHPWHSWVAHGQGADARPQPHPGTTTNLPGERLAEIGGAILLVRVGLVSCTAVHIAEELAGRRSSIRWNVNREGMVQRIRVARFAKGFDRLWPLCVNLFRRTRTGQARVYAAALSTLLGRLAEVIRSQPQLTLCSPTCLRCRNAVLGGSPEGE